MQTKYGARSGANWPAAILFVRTVIRRDWQFLAVTILSCTVAATVATFQYSVYNSFRSASAVIPRVIAADFWIKAASVQCFDFPTPISEDYAGAVARYFPQARYRRIVFGFMPWRSPTGQRGNVALVGMDDSGISATGFVANQSDLRRLNIHPSSEHAVQASIGPATLTLEGTVNSLSTYLGAPYILTSFETARGLLQMDPTSTAFLAGNLTGFDPAAFPAMAEHAGARFPDIALVTGAAFEGSSIDYWQNKTGAGLAIGLAAILASLLMVILMANGVLRFIQRYHQDLLSLLGHGANVRDITLIVAGIATIVAAITSATAILATPILIALFKPLLPWVGFSLWDMLVPVLGVSLALAAAMLASRRAISAFGPDAVFRS